MTTYIKESEILKILEGRVTHAVVLKNHMKYTSIMRTSDTQKLAEALSCFFIWPEALEKLLENVSGDEDDVKQLQIELDEYWCEIGEGEESRPLTQAWMRRQTISHVIDRSKKEALK